MGAMKRTILALIVLLAGTAPASAAFFGENSPLGESFLNTGIEKVAGDVSLEVPMGCGRAWLERTAECFVAPSAINPSEIRFGQQGVSATFRNGEFAGQSIEDVAAGLRSGTIQPSQVPIQTITRNGVTYTLNNRSLTALRQAGIQPTVINDVTGNQFFEQQLTTRLGEMGGEVPPEFVPTIRGGGR